MPTKRSRNCLVQNMINEIETSLMWRNETDFWNRIISVWKEKAPSPAQWNVRNLKRG